MKYIYLLIIFIIINIILLIPIKLRIKKKEELVVELKFLNFKKQLQLKKRKTKLKDFYNVIFNPDLNRSLSLKKENFFVYLILEYGIISKLTYVPCLDKTSKFSVYYEVFLNLSIDILKSYIEHTFKYVEDDYYQIKLDDKLDFLFEIDIKISLFSFITAVFKKTNLFIKTLKKEKTNGN